MTVETVVSALALPPDCRVDRRVPKTLWPSELREAVETDIAELRWLAVLKPANTGVPAGPEVLELQVIAAALAPAAKPARAAQRLHRAVPYPVVLVLQQQTSIALSLVTGPDDPITCSLDDDQCTADWLATLGLAHQPRATLAAVYAAWVAALEALRAARITGHLDPPAAAPAGAAARRQALADHDRLEREIARLRAQAAKEKQIGRRAEMNLRLQRLQSEFAAARAKL